MGSNKEILAALKAGAKDIQQTPNTNPPITTDQAQAAIQSGKK
jgi:hypothetical protein